VVQGAVKGAVTIIPTPLSPPTLLALNSHKSKTLPSNKQQLNNKQQCHPSERMNAIRDVQADILSTLKDTSYFNNDTTRAHINSLHVDNFNRLKNTVRQKRVKCERAIRACIDGQLLAPKQTQYKYHYWLFADYHEILHIELDRIIEIAEYMNDQEDIIKFRTDHYREHGFNSIHNRQPKPFVQCYQNVSSTTSPPKSPTSPVYSSVTKESTNSVHHLPLVMILLTILMRIPLQAATMRIPAQFVLHSMTFWTYKFSHNTRWGEQP
jgi:hypothetical protein